jgi:DNA-binding beta-propeller fold protein YncE
MRFAPCILFGVLVAVMPLVGQDAPKVGPVGDGSFFMPTGQLVRSAGVTKAFAGRPVGVALGKDGRFLYVKDRYAIRVFDTATWAEMQALKFPHKDGASMHGLVLAADGKTLYATSAQRSLHVAAIADDGSVKWTRDIELPGPVIPGDKKRAKGESHSLGIALTKDGKRAYVCMSRNNVLGIVDLVDGKLDGEIETGVAPYDVKLSPDESIAYVTNWGGRKPTKDDKTAKSSGTPTVVDERGVASSGTVMKIDLARKAVVKETKVDLHPAATALSRDGSTWYVPNANSDTISVIDTKEFRVTQKLLVRPDPALPFGSATNFVALAPDDKTLYACNGGNNAIAVIELGEKADIRGYVPTGWYPGAVVSDGKHLYVANVKGEGSREVNPKKEGFNTHLQRGTVSKIPLPTDAKLKEYTAQVRADGNVPQILAAYERKMSNVPAVPVPAKVGDPSVIEHVLYIIKENRTYDQVFGDMKEGNGAPKLCTFGADVSPNLHALAKEFLLLDNFYCNGVLSADGHSWATEGNVTDHLEKAFGGFTRSYTYGDDPLTYSSTGFVWDNVLLKGLSFRNYGEFNESRIVPARATWLEVYQDHVKKAGNFKFTDDIEVDAVRRFSSPGCPGWNLKIPDQVRADCFLREFREAEKKGEWQSLTVMVLPQDHTSGTTPGMPTPNAMVADNDLAVGRIVDAVSHSKFWAKTAIFIIEDDPQNGWDHVDGHRSPCLVLSPYTHRGKTISEFYNQTAVLHTMEQILGVPPMNQLDAMAPLMTKCFADRPDLMPYTVRKEVVALDTLTPPKEKLSAQARVWAEKSLDLDFSDADLADEDTLNRILWFACKADEPYPTEWVGAHGRGLKALKLHLAAK